MSDKICPRCKTVKSKESFYKNRSTPSGLTSYCKDCTKQDQNERYASDEAFRTNRRSYVNDRYKRLMSDPAFVLAEKDRQSKRQKRRWREDPAFRARSTEHNREWWSRFRASLTEEERSVWLQQERQRLAKYSQSDSCVIYFLRMGDFVKIGFTERALAARIKDYVTHSPFPFEVLGSVKADRDYEKVLHCRFKEFHHRGEWFRADIALLEAIKDQCNPLNVSR